MESTKDSRNENAQQADPHGWLKLDWAALSQTNKQQGRLHLLVRRLPEEGRETPEEVDLTIENGFPGDRWNLGKKKVDSQITLMNWRVAEELGRKPEKYPEFGDNLLVDFDLSAANVPPGTRLKVGEAELEVTAKPHTGCGKFKRRFTDLAYEIVNGKERKVLNLRGVHAKVVVNGRVKNGDCVQKLS